MGFIHVRVPAGSGLHWRLETEECRAFGRHGCGDKTAGVNVAILRKMHVWQVFPRPVPSAAPGEGEISCAGWAFLAALLPPQRRGS